MDLEATWQEHKRFIASTGVGALAFGLLALGISGIEGRAEALAKTNARNQSDLLQAISGFRGQEGLEKGKRVALEETAAPAILRALSWTVDPGHLLAADDKNPSITYAARALAAADEVGRRADKAGATLPRASSSNKPDLSFEEGTGLEGPRASEALARIDVTRRLLDAALDAGVRKVTNVKQPEASYQQLEGGAGFLRRIPVGLVFEGGTQELAKLLATFEQEGSFLEVGACHVQRAADAHAEEGLLEVTIELAALTVERDAPADAARQAPAETPDRTPRGPRRRRDR